MFGISFKIGVPLFDCALNRLQQVQCLILRQLNVLVQEVAWLKT